MIASGCTIEMLLGEVTASTPRSSRPLENWLYVRRNGRFAGRVKLDLLTTAGNAIVDRTLVRDVRRECSDTNLPL